MGGASPFYGGATAISMALTGHRGAHHPFLSKSYATVAKSPLKMPGDARKKITPPAQRSRREVQPKLSSKHCKSRHRLASPDGQYKRKQFARRSIWGDLHGFGAMPSHPAKRVGGKHGRAGQGRIPDQSAFAATSTSSTWPGTRTPRQMRAIRPSLSIRKVERSMPI